MGVWCLHCMFGGVLCRSYPEHVCVLGRLDLRATPDLDHGVLGQLEAADEWEAQAQTQPSLGW